MLPFAAALSARLHGCGSFPWLRLNWLGVRASRGVVAVEPAAGGIGQGLHSRQVSSHFQRGQREGVANRLSQQGQVALALVFHGDLAAGIQGQGRADNTQAVRVGQQQGIAWRALLQLAAQAEAAGAQLRGEPGAAQFITVAAKQAQAVHLRQLPGASGRAADAKQFANGGRWGVFPVTTEVLRRGAGLCQRQGGWKADLECRAAELDIARVRDDLIQPATVAGVLGPDVAHLVLALEVACVESGVVSHAQVRQQFREAPANLPGFGAAFRFAPAGEQVGIQVEAGIACARGGEAFEHVQ